MTDAPREPYPFPEETWLNGKWSDSPRQRYVRADIFDAAVEALRKITDIARKSRADYDDAALIHSLGFVALKAYEETVE